MTGALKIPTIFTAVDKFTGPVAAMQKQLTSFSKTSTSINAFKGIGAGADSAFSKIVNLKNAVAVGFGIAAVKTIYDGVVGIAELGDHALQTGLKLGLTAQSVQELQYAAQNEGVANESLISGLEKLNKNVGDLKLGSGSLNSVLKATNPLLAKQLRGVTNNEQAFALITEAINNTPDAFKRAQLAQAAFGKGGQDMIKLLAIGTSGIEALRQEARNTGGLVSNEDAKRAKEFLDVQQKMQKTLSGLSVTLGVALLPKIQEIMQRITEWATANRELISQRVKEFADKFGNALAWVVDNLDTLIFLGKLLIGTLVTLKAISYATAFATWAMNAAVVAHNIALGIQAALGYASIFALRGSALAMNAYKIATGTATAAQWLLNAALNANPIGLIVLAIAAMVAILVVSIKYWNDFGAVLILALGPLGLIISLVQSFRRNWDMVNASFKNGGILEGLRMIHRVILDAMLLPLQQILNIAAKITGIDFISDAAKSLEKFRADMGVNVTTDENGKPLKAINPEANRQEALKETINTNNSNKAVTVDFKNIPQGTNISEGNGVSVMPGFSSTYKMAGA